MNKYLTTIENCANLSESAKVNISNWLTHKKYSEFRSELENMIKDKKWQNLEDSFFRVIPFGTGGRRGVVGIGSNRINTITVGEVAQALCTYLDQIGDSNKRKGIVIACDSRNTSRMFTTLVSEVCAGNGYKVFVYPDVRSTPQLSYSVRLLDAAAGVVITASHNPSSDNGIKIYWNDGGQMVPPYDKELLAVAENIELINSISYDKAAANELITELSSDQDNSYFSAALAQSKRPEATQLKIAYSPLHGAGKSSVYPVLKEAGFDVLLFGPQAEYDGNFTNVTNNISNPELPEASDKVVAFAKIEGCDIAITTDPDADRLGVVVIEKDGSPNYLSGNQISVLIAYHILESLHQKKAIKSNQFMAKTIVTTDMLQALADDYNIELKGNLLVGFKYIGELIKIHVDNGNQEFLFGGEESYGGLVGTYARDKDAASSALMIAELASIAKEEGRTLGKILDGLYEKYGYYQETLSNTTYLGADGFSDMKHIMNTLRAAPPKDIAGYKVVKIRDYLSGDEIPGRSEDVLRFELSPDGADRITIRPSGTEPKIKIYVQTKTQGEELQVLKVSAQNKVETLLRASKLFLKTEEN